MLNLFNFIIFLKILSMISNFKLFPYFNVLQSFGQNVQKKNKKKFCPEMVKKVEIEWYTRLNFKDQ